MFYAIVNTILSRKPGVPAPPVSQNWEMVAVNWEDENENWETI